MQKQYLLQRARLVGRRIDGSFQTLFASLVVGVLSTLSVDVAAAQSLLVVRPAELVFSGVQGGACGAPLSVTIVSAAGSPVSWEAESSAAWLQLSADSGTTSAEITATVDCTGLPAGVHTATLRVEDSAGAGDDVVVTAKLIVNPATRVTLSTWKDGRRGAFSVSTDDGQFAGWRELVRHGLTGTFVMNETEPPPYYFEMYEDGMELGSHLVSHYCHAVDEATLRFEIEENIAGVEAATQSPDEVISLVWPCGFTTLEAQAVAAEYFLSARGYNINELEEPTPANLMNLKSFNSHEHVPFPPADLKSIVDAAEAEGKWANLVLHAFTNDDGAIAYSKTKDVWVAPIGSVVKYILQRDRTVISDYAENASQITFKVSRLPIPLPSRRNLQSVFKPSDEVTFRVDVTTLPFVTGVTVDGASVPFHFKTDGASKYLYFSSAVTTSPRSVTIDLSSAGVPILQSSATELDFAGHKDASVPSQSVQIANAGGGTLSWTATVAAGDAAWLSVSPASGSGPATLTVSVDPSALPEGVHRGTFTVSAAGAVNGTITVPVSFVVYPAGAETYVMSYPDRSSLIDAGWSFLARRADGSARNTEHAVQGDVVYSSAGLRVHADVGDLWEELNNTQNSLFRSLPGHWKSVRVRLDFAPVRNYEQAGIAVYGDDDNYVFIARAFENGNRVTLAHERNGVAQLVGSAAQSAIRNLFLRLDRDGATITGAYSLDGSAWTTIGSVTETINNPRLALLSTGLEGPWTPEGYSDATFHEVHVILDEPPTAPVLSVDATSLGFSTHAGAESVPPRVVTIENAGAGTLEWTATLDAASATWLAAAPSSGVGNGQVSVTVDPSSLTPGTYSGAITVTAAGADNSPQVIGVQLTVHPAGVATFNMRYADRASLLADGWDFQARTSAGTARNTEQSSGATVVYDPGSPLRIPADVGDMWESQNDTRNTLFRDLPSQWTSVRVRMDFAPVQNYQQAGVMVYQDDDNYVYVTRIFNNGHLISLAAENGGTADVIGSAPVSATTDMYLRLDRDLSSGVISGAYSLDGGVTWNALGNVNQTVANPRLALVVGASPGGFPEATFHEVQIFMDQEGASPVIALSDASLSLAVQEGSASISRTISVSNGGDGLLDWIATVGGDGPSWLTVSPGAGAAPSEITVTVNPAGLPVGTYTRSITLTAEGAANSPRVVPVTLTVYSDADELYVFDYANRAALLADGWDFVARTATGSARDTEQTSGAVVVYDPANRVLRVPADVGDLWASLNDTRNSLFRDVPSNWTSVRVLLDFAPTQNYQQAGIVIYDDDDNYVQVTRIFENEQSIVFANEVDGFGTVLAVSPTSATTHIFLRLDRDSSSGAIAGLYSLDGGDTWHTLGSVVQTLSNPRFGLIVGASPGGFPEAVFHVAQVFVESQPAVPVLSLSATSLSFATSEGSFPLPQLLEIENAGTGTLAWTAVVGGSGPEWLSVTPASGSGNGVITVNALAAGLSAGTYTRTITVAAPGAANSPQNVSVTLVVAPLGSEFYSMSYADRASLLADGWDFQARTASGGSRNTEQANGLVVVYDAFGALRIPADMGDLWGEQNDTRNSLFRDLPADWRSVWVRLDFAPWQNYQQAGFVIYDDDDNYVQVTRIYSNGHAIAFAREVQGNAEVLSSAAVSATTNLLLRIDREANVFSAQFSLDGGQTWHVLGSAEQAFDAPRLGLIVGASPDGAPEAAFHSVQVHTQSTPWLSLEESSLTVSAAQGGSVPTRAIGVTVTGAGMPTWTASVDPGASDWLLVSPATGSGSGTMLVAFDTFGLVPGVYTGSITVAAPGVVNGHQTVAVTLTVTSSSVTQYVLDYPNRTSLLADGWDFFARTPFGGLRDTEQTSGAVVQYNVSGKLVVPADVGDLWEGQNDTRNSIFRDLPSDWESVRVQLDFAPVQNYQQAGIVVYDDDDNYVHVTRIFNNGQLVVLANEAGGVASVQGAVATTASQGLLLRLDRNAANEAITGYLSVDGGASWVTLGSVARTFANPRLGLIAGASPGGFPGAYFESVEVWRQP